MEGFWGTLLASIGIPLAIEALKKITGGAPRMGSDLTKGHGAPRIGMYQPTSIYRHMGTSSKRWR